jgi:hypothetical protein
VRHPAFDGVDRLLIAQEGPSGGICDDGRPDRMRASVALAFGANGSTSSGAAYRRSHRSTAK